MDVQNEILTELKKTNQLLSELTKKIEINDILAQHQTELKDAIMKMRTPSEFYTEEEAIIMIGYSGKPRAGYLVLLELKKQGLISDLGTDKFSKSEIDRIAPKIDREYSFDRHYKLIAA